MADAEGVGKVETVKKKRKRVSKKSKRSWRKNVDITDVEEYLDEVRRQERTGGIISHKKNEELFYVAKNTDEKEERENVKSAKAKKRKLVKNDESSDESDDERRQKNLLLRNHQNKLQKTELYDLWSPNDDKTSKSKTETYENEHYLKTTKKMTVKQPKTAYKIRSTAPALAVCHPGASYNPAFEDHQELLMTACEVEIMKQKDIDKIKRQLQLPSEEELAKLPSWEEEMSQGLFDKHEDKNNESENDDDNDDVLMLPSNGKKDRKTKKDKKRANERKKEEESSKEMHRRKVKENEIFRMKSIKRTIKKGEEKTQKRQEEKQKKMIEASSKPQRLGRQKFEEMNIEVQLTNELRGSLRNLKPEGNLFEDRFKNLQRRNIIEPRRPVMPHRKYKLKEYEKRSYKNFDLQEKLKKKKTKN
ncbi:ribosome biogenesis protein NOP53-like [Dendronephthya gigantea]|uniref:ribosome biogenesis protein NOP53-like n=1 Tax=Dendronephthya gigantea TaxID=151771 RepID=UPI00106AD447|nr:ribosome biogenesis protein NOP53-like [Dendronephthya gigantea]